MARKKIKRVASKKAKAKVVGTRGPSKKYATLSRVAARKAPAKKKRKVKGTPITRLVTRPRTTKNLTGFSDTVAVVAKFGPVLESFLEVLPTVKQLTEIQRIVLDSIKMLLTLQKAGIKDSWRQYVEQVLRTETVDIGELADRFIKLFAQTIHQIGVTKEELLEHVGDYVEAPPAATKKPSAKVTKGKEVAAPQGDAAVVDAVTKAAESTGIASVETPEAPAKDDGLNIL